MAITTRFKNLVWFALATSVLIAAWILWPYIVRPYVRIPSSTISIELPCVPDEIRLESRTGFLQLNSATLSVNSEGDLSEILLVPMALADIGIEDLSVILIRLTPTDIAAIADQFGKDDKRLRSVLAVNFAPVPVIDLSSIAWISRSASTSLCRNPFTSSGEDLRARIRDPNAEVMRYRLVQEQLSDVVVLVNQTVGNFALAAMVVYLLWLLYDGARVFLWTFAYDDSRLTRVATKLVEGAPPQISAGSKEEIVQSILALKHRRWNLAKTLGPAIGFLLTVSSLAAALHPSVQARHDAYQFVGAIQIAVLSTLIGLLIRIVAQVSQSWIASLGLRLKLLRATDQH